MSSRNYYPDKWVVLEFTVDGETHKKVFASWYGNFTNGDSWKLSSAIDSTEETAEAFVFHCCSGSSYHCHKNTHGMNMYSMSMYDYWSNEVKDMKISIAKGYGE